MMQSKRLKIVVASFFPAFQPPSSGGEQRLYFFYKHFSEYADIVLVSMTYQDAGLEWVEHDPGFTECRVPKHPDNDARILSLSQAGIGSECSGYVAALLGEQHADNDYTNALAEQIATADLVIHESPFTFPYDRTAAIDGKPRIYNAYNVEALLAQQMLQGLHGQQAASFIEKLEQRMVEHSSLVLAISEEERQYFIQHYHADPDRVVLAPNGYEPNVKHQDKLHTERKGAVLFMGSAHPPNIQAAEYICNVLAPALPEVKFEIIGSVCRAISSNASDNVKLLGIVTPDEKESLLRNCRAAINPLSSGAGTNLKMLDYLGAGAPVISTPIGARGLELKSNQDILISDLAGFQQALQHLLSSPLLAKQLSQSAATLAEQQYRWRAIVERVAPSVLRAVDLSKSDRKEKLVWICDYPVLSPQGGGQVRIRRLLEELSANYSLVYLCLSDAESETVSQVSHSFFHIEIPKTAAHRQAEEKSRADGPVSISDILASRYCKENPKFVEVFQKESSDATTVVFEQCYLSPMLDVLFDTKKVIYSSQNVESNLKHELLSSRPDIADLVAEVVALESKMLKSSDLVVCVSDFDRQKFRSIEPDKRYVVIENGVSIPARPTVRRSHVFGMPVGVFLGSAHPPNVDAALEIAHNIAPFTPGVHYVIAGSVCNALGSQQIPDNVHLLGFLADEEKDALLSLADFAINPLRSGGGSSLKVPDFFSHSLPLITTEIGVRGYPVMHDVHCIITSNLSAAINALVQDTDRMSRLGSQGYALIVERFDWKVLASRYTGAIARLHRPVETKPRILTVTYRFGEPLRGGAEVFLMNVLREMLNQQECELTIASTAVSTIENIHGYSALYSGSLATDSLPAWAKDVHLFQVDDADSNLMDTCRMLDTVWMSDARRIANSHVASIEDFSCAGGWHYPEKSSDRTQRWTSSIAQIKLPASAQRLDIQFHAHSLSKQPCLAAPNGSVISAELIDGWLQYALPGLEGLYSIQCEEVQWAAGDHRELGVCVHAVRALDTKGNLKTIDLNSDLSDLKRNIGLDAWTATLHETASSATDASIRERFTSVRGPKSEALVDWLQKNVEKYDVVLVQGVPFATSVDAVDICNRHVTPVVVLPHVHIEDRFYHWPEFYRCFRNADAVIAAPEASVPYYFNRVGARSLCLPGGGVNIQEFDTARDHEFLKCFGALHKRQEPFILCLGRKSGSKRYDKIIAAQQHLLGQGVDVDLVLIGPDEDGRKIDHPRVYNYGAQPRDVVLGALRAAKCLVNMSESESFGIVVLESWLSGTPVVVNRNCAAFEELVLDGHDGTLVESDDQLVSAIARYLQDDKLAELHAQNGRHKTHRYAWSTIAAGIYDELNFVANMGRGNSRNG